MKKRPATRPAERPAGPAREDPAAATRPARRGDDPTAGFLLWQVTNRWQRELRAALRGTGLTHVQYALLTAARHLAERDAPATQTALAERAGTDEMMTSQVVRALERRALVERTPHPTDRRARAVALTPAGQRAVEEADRIVREADRDFFAGLGGKRAKFVKRLRRLATPKPRAADRTDRPDREG